MAQITQIAQVGRDLVLPPAQAGKPLINILNDLRSLATRCQVQEAWNPRTMFGAAGDGVTDDTAAIQNAHDTLPAGGGSIYLPPGIYIVRAGVLNFTKPVWLSGAGIGATTIKTADATGDVLLLNGGYQRVSDLQIVASPSVPRLGGGHIHVGPLASYTRLDHLLLQRAFYGVLYEGAAIFDWSNSDVRDCTSNAIAPGAAAGYFKSSQATRLSRIVMDNNPAAMPTYNLAFEACSDAVIYGCEALDALFGLSLFPGAGQAVTQLWADHTFFDHSGTNGVLIRPTAGGSVVRCRFANCWTGSAGAQGALVGGGGGVVDGYEFLNHYAYLNVSDGIQVLSGPLNGQIIGGEFGANGRDGIRMGSAGNAPTDWIIHGVRSGNVGALAGNTGWGVNVTNAAAANFRIGWIDTRGNTAGGLQNLGAGLQVVANNM